MFLSAAGIPSASKHNVRRNTYIGRRNTYIGRRNTHIVPLQHT